MWLNNLSDAVCAQESKSTTSTSTLPITDSTIFTFAAAALNIIAPMLHSLDWSADCLNVAQSALTLLQENMNYARQASNYLFIEARLRDGWRDYLSAASDLQSELEFRIRDGRAAQVLFERESGGGNPAPRRETRQGAAADAGASTPDRRDGGSGSPENNPVLAGTLSASGAGTARTGNSYSERDMLIPVAIDAIDVRNSRGQGGVSGTLQSKSTGGYSLNYINPIAVIKGAAVGREPENGPQYGEVITDGSVYTLNTSETHVVAFTQNQREEVRDLNGVAGALAADAGAHQTNYVAFGLSTFETPKFAEELSPTVVTPSPTGGGQPPAVAIAFDRSKPQWLEEQTGVLRVSGSVTEGVSPGKADYWCATTQTGVRRLTPTECERLQGFPDGHTDGQSDSTRYRQLGNAVCVNVAEWIGKRIVAAEGGA